MKIHADKFLVFSALVFTLVTACASAPQKAAVNDASAIDLNSDYDLEIEELNFLINEEPCYIIYSTGISITSIDGNRNKSRLNYFSRSISSNRYITGVSPGTHHLRGIVTGSNISNSSTADLPFTAEEGKNYELYMESKRIHSDFNTATYSFEFFIREITDPALMETVKKMAVKYRSHNEETLVKSIKSKQGMEAFDAYMELNPDRLEGIWAGGNVKKLEFTGNNVICTYSAMTYLGTYAYNENTIIISWISMFHSWTKKDMKYEPPQKDIWYYQLMEDKLHILYGKKETYANIKGKLSRAD